MFRSPQAPTSSPQSRPNWLEHELGSMSPGQRRFFELVVGITRVLFVPFWLVLCAGWAGRCLVLTLTDRRTASPRRALPPLPDFECRGTLGYGLYLAGASIAVAVGLLSMIGLCFLPVITVFWVVATLEQEGPVRAALGALGAVGLEALMLLVYFRYMRGVLAQP